MLIGIPKEIKDREYRVGLTPPSVAELVNCGHQVIVETNAGSGIDYNDSDYIDAGAKIAKDIEEVYAEAKLIVKVKEPQPLECKLLKKDQILFSYLHLAAEKELAKMLIDSGCVAIAFETVTAPDNTLPLLVPMSEIAGRLSIQAGAKTLEKSNGGRGILLGGAFGVAPGKVTIIGGGIAGVAAAKIAIGMGANVVILDKSLSRIRHLCDILGGGNVNVLYASSENIRNNVIDADLVVGAVLIPGASAPKLVTKANIKDMKQGSVMVDISIDQGGCFETSRPTTYSDPSYIADGVIHYCVTNMPGAVPRTSTQALENATLPYVMKIAGEGYKKALLNDLHLRNGLNIMLGKVTHRSVAHSLGYEYNDAELLLKS